MEVQGPFSFCQVQDSFVREFNYLVTGWEPNMISNEAHKFLWGKGVDEERKQNILVWIYEFHEKPLLLPKFLLGMWFIAEICKHYHLWLIIFERKKNKQFISLPFIVGELTMRNVAHFM